MTAYRSLILLALLFLNTVCLAEKQPAPLWPGFEKAPFDEQVRTFTNNPGVRIHLNAPLQAIASDTKVKLVYYGLPNGNTIEQTVGKKMKAGDDWHFNIQHIGAQTRFVRRVLTNEVIVVAYLANSQQSWPAWRKANGDATIPDLLASVKTNIPSKRITTVLTGHSGGGSLTFGYFNSVKTIPDEVVRMAFLDSNYAYDTALHRDKLAEWLKESDEHSLLVFAYHDDIALLNGKTFVSAAGGTWGRSHQMRKDFEAQFAFKENVTGEIITWSALEGRMRFFLKENPEKKIYHTVQVEKNGFIHALLAGTPFENAGYNYFGPRAYEDLVSE